jgi:hypothetical protein
MYSPDSPASMSIHEEATFVAEGPMMGVFNNLVMFDQHVKQNSLGSIVPDLATGWSWNEDGTELTFPLRQGVRWHDGKPFTAKDVECTLDLLTGKSSEKHHRQLPPLRLRRGRRGRHLGNSFGNRCGGQFGDGIAQAQPMASARHANVFQHLIIDLGEQVRKRPTVSVTQRW